MAEPVIRHYRKRPLSGDSWIYRVGCGLLVARSRLTTLRHLVTCTNCKKSVWFTR